MKRSLIILLPLVLYGIILYSNSRQFDPAITKGTSSLQVDGPYVFYKKEKVFVKYIMDSSGTEWVKTDTIGTEEKKNYTLHVATDIPGQTFPVTLQDQFQDENSEFAGADKIFALSYMEGQMT